VGTIARS